jgi:hypothetical protein
MTVADLLAEAGWEDVDLVKLDIEGGEWELLEARSFDGVTRTILGELHGEGAVQRCSGLLAGWEVSYQDEPHTTFCALAPDR